MDEEKLQALVEWIAENMDVESAFLYPHPQYNVNAFELLDFIAEWSNTPQDKIGKWVDSITQRSKA